MKIEPNTIIEPYSHDCDKCEWVGWFSSRSDPDHPPANVYLCGKTVVIRFSSEPSDYWSSTAGECTKGSIRIMR